MGKLLYQTHRSNRATMRTLLFMCVELGAVYLFHDLLLGDYKRDFLWYFAATGLVICAIMGMTRAVVLFTTKHPLQIYEGGLKIGSLFPFTVPRENIIGRGIHARRGDICLEVRDAKTGQAGQMALLWRIIDEPVNEVVAQLDQWLGDETLNAASAKPRSLAQPDQLSASPRP